MKTYTDEQVKAVNEVIDNLTSEYLDNYCRDSLKRCAKSVMDGETESNDPQDVGDAVYDMADFNFSGNITMSLMCRQMYPESEIFTLRNEIIKALN